MNTTTETPICISDYLHTALDPKRNRKAIKIITQIITKTFGKDGFDAFAFMGMSGSLIVPTLCHILHKNMIMVRKDKDDSHSKMKVEGFIEANKIIIIDDLICSGSTLSTLISKLIQLRKLYTPVLLQIVGIFLYHDSSVWKNTDISSYVNNDDIKNLLKNVPVYAFQISDWNGEIELHCSVPVQKILGVKRNQYIKL